MKKRDGSLCRISVLRSKTLTKTLTVLLSGLVRG